MYVCVFYIHNNNIHVHNIYIQIFFAVVEMLFHDVINLLPTNPWYAIEILKRSPNLSKLSDKFKNLSKTIDDHVVIYETLLPYVYKKCGYNVLQLIDTLERTLKSADQSRKLKEFRNGK